MKRFLVSVVLVSISVLVWAQESDVDMFREAERRFESGDFELALDRYRALIDAYPISQYVPDAQYRVAIALYRTGQSQAALEQLDRVSRRFRSTRYVELIPFWEGVISYDLKRYADAVRFLDEYRAQGPSDPDPLSQSWYYTGLAEIGRGDEVAARSALESMLALTDQPAKEGYALTLLLSLYAKAGLSDPLLALVSRVDPAQLDERWRRNLVLYTAEAYYAQGNLAEAIPRYRASEGAPAELATLAFQRLFQLAQDGKIDDQPSDVLRRAEQALAGRTDVLKEFWLRVGIDSYNQHRYDLAELYFRRIWDLRQSESIPASVPLYLSRLLDQRGDAAGAEQVLSDYLTIYGDESEERLRVLIALGNLQLRQGRISLAIATLQPAYEEYARGPYFPEAAYQYAFALRTSGRAADALKVIDSAFSAGRVGGVQADLLRLRGRILEDQGNDADALQALFEYLPLRPADAQAALEYANLLFSLRRYPRVVDEVPTIISELQSRGALTSAIDGKLSYVRGLALLNQESYADAAGAFQRVLDTGGPSDPLRPFALYYLGWAGYRGGDYGTAEKTFGQLLVAFPAHPQDPQAAYLAGWSSFQLGHYAQALEALGKVRLYTTTEKLTNEATFLQGRVLATQGSLQQAAATFRGLYLDHPQSEYADDAWFEYAEAQVGLGNTDAAVSAFSEMIAAYPDSPLAESASFRKAEVLFQKGRYADAQDAFFAYRTTFRDASRMDAALYWGGVASQKLGEGAGALLLWERLISDYRESSFRADAMSSAAATHSDRGEYRQALNLYTELRATYPDAARAAGADRRIDELVLLINGLSEREAELLVTIEGSGGAESDNGRQAIIELARMAIYESTSTSTDAADVIPMLVNVSANSTVDPASASQALFLRGEYRYGQGDLQKAADLYLQAATVGASDRDLAALSIYRTAVMYSKLGRPTEVDALVTRLEQNFPGSEWLEEARALQRGDSHE